MEPMSKEKLLRYLESVGKATFVRCFDVVRGNFDKTNRHKLGEMLLKYNPVLSGNNKKNSLPRIASYAMAIFNSGQEYEALEICANSPRLDDEVKNLAISLLRESCPSEISDAQIAKSIKDTSTARKSRLESVAGAIPEKVSRQAYAYKRNPDVVAEVLTRANGICESCGQPAPFIREAGELKGMPFLEAHHKKWLSEGGEDSIGNAVALCPNCHRREHFGKRAFS